MSGLYMLYRLRELNLRVKVIEAGTGVGGTWYSSPVLRFHSSSHSLVHLVQISPTLPQTNYPLPPGTGTATQGRASTPNPTATPIPSPRPFSRNGTGKSTSPRNPRRSRTSTTSPTSSTCGARSSSAPVFPPLTGTKPAGHGPFGLKTRPRKRSAAASSSLRSGRSARRPCRGSPASPSSRARACTRRGGRTRR